MEEEPLDEESGVDDTNNEMTLVEMQNEAKIEALAHQGILKTGSSSKSGGAKALRSSILRCFPSFVFLYFILFYYESH